MASASPRDALARIFADVVARIDVEASVRVGLAPVVHLAPAARTRIVAVGKAAPAMMRGALAGLPRPASALVVTADGVSCEGLPSFARVVRGAHPLPNASSLDAAAEAFRAVASGRGGHVIALVSGGASSLVCAPHVIDLDEKRAVLAALLHSGADIRAMNTVRRHISRIKGGGLARAAAPAIVSTLVLSDVLDGGPHDIGSGPTTWDPTTRDDARAILARYTPAHANIPLRESLKPHEAAAARLRIRTVLGPADLARVMVAALRVAGFEVHLLPPTGADVAALAAGYADLARGLAPGVALVRAAEPTIAVTSKAPGRGGRSSHLAATVGRVLPSGVAFLAGASDGVDGASDAAGASVDRESLLALGDAAIDDALAGFATADLHARAGTALHLGPTGLNLADVHVLARATDSRRAATGEAMG